jgi:hypothetical protein
MSKLTEDLKRILSGLAQQDAGEFLTMRDKMGVLGIGTEANKGPASHPPARVNKTTRRIALVTDGRGLGAPLDYVLESCTRQEAKIDLLIHGMAKPSSLSMLEKRIQTAGLECHRVQLGVTPSDDILDYIHNHPSLMFLVAIPDDYAVKPLIEELIPKRGGRVPVPVVLIEEREPAHIHSKSVA